MITETTRTITISALEVTRAVMKMIEEKNPEVGALINSKSSEWHFSDLGCAEITVVEKVEGSN